MCERETEIYGSFVCVCLRPVPWHHLYYSSSELLPSARLLLLGKQAMYFCLFLLVCLPSYSELTASTFTCRITNPLPWRGKGWFSCNTHWLECTEMCLSLYLLSTEIQVVCPLAWPSPFSLFIWSFLRQDLPDAPASLELFM